MPHVLSTHKAAAFALLIHNQKDLERKRSERHLSTISRQVEYVQNEQVHLFFELLSAQDLRGTDISVFSVIGGGEATSDPYVTMRVNGQVVHRTKHINAT